MVAVGKCCWASWFDLFFFSCVRLGIFLVCALLWFLCVSVLPFYKSLS